MNYVEKILQNYIIDPTCIGSIKNAYDNPHRKYHNLNHLDNVFKAAHLHDITLTAIQVWAIIFHDIVYDPGAQYNESKSAAWATELLENTILDLYYVPNLDQSKKEYICQQVGDAILATAKHLQDQKNLATSIMMILDLDLADLGTDKYWENSALIRKEFAFQSHKVYISNRIYFIEAMLARNLIYYTKEFKKCEERARVNLQQELTVLQTLVI